MEDFNQEENSLTPIEEVSEALKELPEEKRKIIEKTISLSMQGVVPMANPIYDKITPEHITSLLVNSDSESKRVFLESQYSKIFITIIVLAVLITFGLIIYAFRNHIKDIEELLKMLLTFGLGAFGGYGLGIRKDS